LIIDQLFFLTDERVSSDLKKAIMQARLDKKLTQAELAKVCVDLEIGNCSFQ
jgi:ribosome-binding protein aMBF1 (putative translation factor)